jgi:hypothetical protein
MNLQTNVKARVKWCKENKVLPYVMRSDDCYTSENKSFYADIAAWCNQPALFKKLNFKEFMAKRTNNKARQRRHIETYITMETK